MLKSHDDGKGKDQSVSVWSTENMADAVESGYGRTSEEALKNFQSNMDKHIQKLHNYNWKVVKGRKL